MSHQKDEKKSKKKSIKGLDLDETTISYERKLDREGTIKKKTTIGKVKAFFSHPLVTLVIGGIIMSLYERVVLYTSTYRDIPKQLIEIQSSVGDLSDAIPQMLTAIEELQTIHANSGDVIRKDLSNISIAAISVKSDGVLAEYIRSQEFTNKMDINLGEPSWAPEQVVAIGSDGTEYKAYEIYNTRVIFSYMENGQDIIFSGQINENNNWDGRCIINVYDNDKFVIATEANYDDGKRIYYEQLFCEDNEWIYSERYTYEETNIGDTWKYQKSEDILKSIDLFEPDENDLIVPKEFIIPLGQKKTGHYHGNTSNGDYNDDTGEAYYISYDDSGYARTIYKGRFVDGVFEDSTGKAWYITRESRINTDMNYQYYKGEFQFGHPVSEKERGESSIFDEKITLEEANRIVIGEEFYNEIKWDEDKFFNNSLFVE